MVKKAVKKASKKVVAKKKGVKKVAPGVVKKASLKTTTKKATPKRTLEDMGVDFAAGSDMAIAWEIIQEGGESRQDVAKKLEAKFGDRTTRNGKPKPISTIMHQVIKRALASGYVMEQQWRMVPGPSTTAPSTSDEATPAKSAPAKKVGKKVVKKKAAKKVVKKGKKAKAA